MVKTFKWSKVFWAVEIAFAAIMFLLMLYNCGKYIDIRINGRSNTLSPMPENDKRILVQIGALGNNTQSSSELIQPVFSGFKTSVGAYGINYSDKSEQNVKKVAYEYIPDMFSGTSEKVNFDSERARREYINNLKNSTEYILLCFYSDIPAAAFLPSLVGYSDRSSDGMYFNVQNLFILPDNEGNAYSICVSSDFDVNIVKPKEPVAFNAKELEAYNSSTGFVAFEYADSDYILPQLINTVKINDYSVTTAYEKLGHEKESEWILKTLSAFKLNKNLARSFVTRDGSELNFVDGENQLFFSINGDTEYKTTGNGVNLYEYLGYNAEQGEDYSFSETITALKKLIYSLDRGAVGNNAELCITEVLYNDEHNKLSVRMKYFANSICVTNNEYDAVFEISAGNIVYAKYKSLNCTMLNSMTSCMPQKYSQYLTSQNAQRTVNYALLTSQNDKDDKSRHNAVWASGIINE